MKHLTKALVLMLLVSGHCAAVEIQKWERIPIAIPLLVDQERIIFVDQNVRVGLPGDLASRLRVQSTGGAVYLRASEPIQPTRLQLQDVATGEIMLIDIMATPVAEGQAALEPVKIVPGNPVASRYGRTGTTRQSTAGSAGAPQAQGSDEPAVPKRETPIPVVLTRYAAQMMYAPLRTVEPVTGVAQVRIKAGINLSTLLPVLPVQTSTLGAWRLDDFYITAIKLQNTSDQQLKLDPRELMGNFVSAAFQHPDLGSRGQASDTTTLYLVTRGKGLAESLLPVSINQIDPKGARHGDTQR